MTTPAGPSPTYPSAALGELLAGAAAAYGQRPVIVDGTTETSYAVLYQSALRFANGMRDHGVSHVYRVALIAPNSADFITAYYGILLAGATVVPINPAQPRDALLAQLVDLDVRAAVVHADAFSTFADVAEQTRIDVIITCGDRKGTVADLTAPVIAMAQLIDAQPTYPTLPPVPTEALAHLAFTGGTTGRSKAVQILHRNVIANVTQLTFVRLGRRIRLDETGPTLDDGPAQDDPAYLRAGAESVLAIAPFFHAHGLVTLSFFVLNGFTIVPFRGRFDSERYLHAVGHDAIFSDDRRTRCATRPALQTGA